MHFYRLWVVLLFSACGFATASSVIVVKALPHAQQFFTQGLIIEQGLVTETTGQYGHSVLATYPLGKQPERKLKLASQYFGEGLTKFDQRYFWLSWKAGIAFEVDAHDFRIIKRHNYHGQGWGITHNGQELIMSNGSNILQFKNANTFNTITTLAVTDNGKPVHHLNELEWVNGYVLANIWREDRIVKIDPHTGLVTQSYDLSSLRAYFSYPKANVLNGIAYDQHHKKLYVTGKYWPTLFEIQLND